MADRFATHSYDREHVTPYLRRHPTVKRANIVSARPEWKSLRVTVDYPEDLWLIRAIEALRPLRSLRCFEDLVSVFECHPHLSEINSNRRVNRLEDSQA